MLRRFIASWKTSKTSGSPAGRSWTIPVSTMSVSSPQSASRTEFKTESRTNDDEVSDKLGIILVCENEEKIKETNEPTLVHDPLRSQGSLIEKRRGRRQWNIKWVNHLFGREDRRMLSVIKNHLWIALCSVYVDPAGVGVWAIIYFPGRYYVAKRTLGDQNNFL